MTMPFVGKAFLLTRIWKPKIIQDLIFGMTFVKLLFLNFLLQKNSFLYSKVLHINKKIVNLHHSIIQTHGVTVALWFLVPSVGVRIPVGLQTILF